MSDIEKEVQKFIDRDDFETCLHCSFYPGGGSWMCLAPWTDGQMEDEDIDPCREGVHRYLSGQPGPHLKKLVDKNVDYLWLREKGEFTAKNPAATREEDNHNETTPK